MRILDRRAVVVLALLAMTGCFNDAYDKPVKPYGVEQELSVHTLQSQVWAIAPAINLSGERDVDPLLQADLLYAQLQQVHGMTVIPVNRVLEVYSGLKIEKVETVQQAHLVCDLLGANALVVPTVTAYDPYDPPKMGASLELFIKPRDYVRPANFDPQDRGPAGADDSRYVKQAVGMFDAINGSVLRDVSRYAAGRNDPNGAMTEREYLLSMDRYCGFVYHELIAQLLVQQGSGF
jgi:hypothetical protein